MTDTHPTLSPLEEIERLTLQIANDMLATVEGNSNINVDFTAPVPDPMYLNDGSNVGLEI